MIFVLSLFIRVLPSFLEEFAYTLYITRRCQHQLILEKLALHFQAFLELELFYSVYPLSAAGDSFTLKSHLRLADKVREERESSEVIARGQRQI